MTDKQRDLSCYRFSQAEETLTTAQLCQKEKFYKDAINRAYYAAFYAVKAVLAISDVDFKRHKDVVAYFNQNYVATEVFPKDYGRRLARLQKKRENSDYDDFYIACITVIDDCSRFMSIHCRKLTFTLQEQDSIDSHRSEHGYKLGEVINRGSHSKIITNDTDRDRKLAIWTGLGVFHQTFESIPIKQRYKGIKCCICDRCRDKQNSFFTGKGSKIQLIL